MYKIGNQYDTPFETKDKKLAKKAVIELNETEPNGNYTIKKCKCKSTYKELRKGLEALTKAYWKNQCPECGNDLSSHYCEDCEQDLSDISVWIGLVDIALDNFS